MAARQCHVPPVAPAFRALVAAVLLLASGLALAAAGKVLFVAGDVRAERGATVVLRVGDPVEVGDVVVTAAQSRAQILMADGAKLALRAGTRFRIDALALPTAVTAPGQATATAADGSSIATLLKGGFRTTTGSIGRKDPNAYQVRTPVGVLGIRGTDYTAVFCTGDCSDAPGVRPGDAIRDGLYLGVTTGSIAFRTSGGQEIVLKAGEFAFIPLTGAAPESLQTAPAFLLGDGAGPLEVPGTPPGPTAGPTGITDFGGRRSPAGTNAPGDGKTPAGTPGPGVTQPIQGTTPNGGTVDLTGGTATAPQRRDVSFPLDALGQSPFSSSVAEDTPGQYGTDAAGNLTAFTGPVPGLAGAQLTASYQIGTSAVAESGVDTLTQIRWGRWAGGAAQVTVNQNSQAYDLGKRSLHWVVSSDFANPPPAIPISGVADYTLVGATHPTDAAGGVGKLGSATFQANFDLGAVTSTLSLAVGNNQWTASGQGTIGAQAGLPAHQFSGNYGAVTVTDTGTGGQLAGRGAFSGFFSGPGSPTTPGVPGGVGLTYSLQDTQGQQGVQGAAVFKAP